VVEEAIVLGGDQAANEDDDVFVAHDLLNRLGWPRSNRKPATRRPWAWHPNLEELKGREWLSGLFVLGNNDKLWLEAPAGRRTSEPSSTS
jgi:hypothetical protein